ncbi:MAG: translation initiation factor [Sandaracinaceae bacterium]|nr:translation initiation factor [Sandaracinaceae bacterium]
MSKKNVDTSGATPLKHSPFAALGPSAPSGPPAAPAIVAPPAAPVALDGKLVVRHERKGRGGKTVTRIAGLPASACEAIATRMKKALGVGATIEDDDVLLLGDVVERAARWLEREGAQRVVRGG